MLGREELMVIRVRVPGSCGELVQGICHGTPFLLTCPVPLYSTVCVSDRPAPYRLPEKAAQAMKVTLAHLQRSVFPYHVSLTSSIPRGKGMASSSADVAAVIQAVACACGTGLSEQEVGHLAARVDPVDGVFARGLSLIQYRSGNLIRSYAPVPPIWIAILDTGGTVDTQAFHRQWDDTMPLHTAPAVSALSLLDEGLTAQRIGEAATRSALAPQAVLPKPDFFQLVRACRKMGALGVNTAHSGTVCGVLFSSHTPFEEIKQYMASLTARFPDYTLLNIVPLISGAMDIEKEE